MASLEISSLGALAPGTEVEVHTRYENRWVRGFEIAGIDTERSDAQRPELRRYVVRRRSDRVVLPVPFRADQIRPTG